MKVYKANQLDDIPEGIGVYVIYFSHSPTHGYIGSTKNFKTRAKQHVRKLNKGSHGNFKLRGLWRHYKNNFRFGVLETVEEISEARKREQIQIDLYPQDKLYNIDREVKRHRSD